jgi:hypothetical protein
MAAYGQIVRLPTGADSAWQSLQSLTLPPNLNGQRPSTAQEIAQLQQEAQQANLFYGTFPSDSRANSARKLEALSQLQEVQLGAANAQPAALALATAFVNDTTHGLQDRFDVALSASLVSQAGMFQGMGPLRDGPAYQAVADALYGQFGDTAPMYAYYLSLTLCADNATAVNVASKIQTMNAPAWVKAQAQVVLNRAGLVGTIVPLTLTTAANQQIDMSQASGQTTVVYFWGGAGYASDLAAINSIKANVPADVRWIYVALNSPSPVLATAQANAPVAGIQCFEPVSLAGWVPETLFLQITPYAYVFKANGILSGYGPPALIPALVNAAGQ